MAFFQNNNTFDLGELHIENLFISDLMPSASGTHVKVYLLGMMFSQSSKDGYRFDNRILAQQLQLPLQDIIESWIYWENVGVVKRHPQESGEDFDIEFLSLRALYIQNNYVSKATTLAQKRAKSPLKKQNEAYSLLLKEVETLVGHPLSHGEYRMLHDFYDNYYPDVAIIAKAVSITYLDRNIRNMKAVKTLITTWTDARLLSMEDILKYNQTQDERYALYKEVLKTMGLSYRMPTQAEKETFDRWMDTLGFSKEELLKFIVFFSKKNSHLNLNYLDKAFNALHQEGILTLEAYELKLQDKPKEKSTRSNKKQVTIEKENTYSDEELEAMLLRKKNTSK